MGRQLRPALSSNSTHQEKAYGQVAECKQSYWKRLKGMFDFNSTGSVMFRPTDYVALDVLFLDLCLLEISGELTLLGCGQMNLELSNHVSERFEALLPIQDELTIGKMLTTNI